MQSIDNPLVRQMRARAAWGHTSPSYVIFLAILAVSSTLAFQWLASPEAVPIIDVGPKIPVAPTGAVLDSAGDIADLSVRPVNPWTRTTSRPIDSAPFRNVVATNGSATYLYADSRFIKYNSTGGIVWNVTLSRVIFDAVAVADGVLVTYCYGGNATLRKIHGNGTLGWLWSYNCSGSYPNIGASRIVVSGDGDIFWFGSRESTDGADHPFVEKLDQAGSLLWHRNEPSPGKNLIVNDAVEFGDALYYTGKWGSWLAVGKIWKNGTNAWAQNVTGEYYEAANVAETNGTVFVFSGHGSAPGMVYAFGTDGTIIDSWGYDDNRDGELACGFVGVNGTLVALCFDVDRLTGGPQPCRMWTYLVGFNTSGTVIWSKYLDFNEEDDGYFDYLAGDLALAQGGEIAASYYMEDGGAGLARYRVRKFVPNTPPSIEVLPGRRTFLDTENAVLDVIATDATLNEGSFIDVYHLCNGDSSYQSVLPGVVSTIVIYRSSLRIGSNEITFKPYDRILNGTPVLVSVTFENTPPSVWGTNVTYEFGTAEHYATITMLDVRHQSPWYEVILDGQTRVANTSYFPPNGTNQVNVDGLAVGIHNYTVVMHDGLGAVTRWNGTVTVFNVPPAPSSFFHYVDYYSEGYDSDIVGVYVTFADNSTGNVTCTLRVDGGVVYSGPLTTPWDGYIGALPYFMGFGEHPDQDWWEVYFPKPAVGSHVLTIIIDDGLGGNFTWTKQIDIVSQGLGYDLDALVTMINCIIIIGIPALTVLLVIRRAVRKRRKGRAIASDPTSSIGTAHPTSP